MSPEEIGLLAPSQVRRLRWLVPLVLAVAALVGWTSSPYLHYEPPKPAKPTVVFGASDGLPRVLVAGEVYTASFTVTFPPDWRNNAWVWVSGRVVPERFAYEMNDVLLCDAGWAEPAGQTLPFSCQFPAPLPGAYTLTAGVVMSGPSRDYQHVVVPRQGNNPYNEM
jgi:hypothetical protein